MRGERERVWLLRALRYWVFYLPTTTHLCLNCSGILYTCRWARISSFNRPLVLSPRRALALEEVEGRAEEEEEDKEKEEEVVEAAEEGRCEEEEEEGGGRSRPRSADPSPKRRGESATPLLAPLAPLSLPLARWAPACSARKMLVGPLV